MSTWPAVADLGDMPTLTAGIRPFSEVFPPQRDPALAPEKTVDELLAECRQIRADLDLAVSRSRQARGADTDTRRAA